MTKRIKKPAVEQNPSEEELVKAFVDGKIIRGRFYQNERGTWLCRPDGTSTKDSTPPLEEREWSCPTCFSELHEMLKKVPPIEWIDWQQMEKDLGSETTDKFKAMVCKSQRRFPSIFERVRNIQELHLKADVICRQCRVNLNNSEHALVEVY